MADTITAPAAPGPGHNSKVLDLSLALDADQLLRDLEADTVHLFARCTELLAAFDRFDAANKEGIQSEEVAGRAGEFAKQISTHLAAIDARRVAIKAPVLAAQRTIDNFFKRDLADPVERIKAAVIRRIEDYQRAQREEAARLAREEAARQRAAADALAAAAEKARQEGQDDAAAEAIMDAALEAEARAETTAATAAAPPPIRSDMGVSVGTRMGPWQVRVTDLSKVPAQFLMANEPVLLATAKTDPRIARGEQPVPGVEFYRETRASIR